MCWALTRLVRLKRLFRRPPTGPVKSILFVKLVEQGSTVLASQAFDLARDLVGREHLYFLVFERNRPILDLMDRFDGENVFTIRDGTFRHFVIDTLRALRRLRKLRIDATVDMEGFARASAVLAVLSGAKRRAGYYRYCSEAPYRGRLLTHPLHYTFYEHCSRQFLALVKALTVDGEQVPMLKAPVPADDVRPRPFVPEPHEEAAMRDLLAREAGREVGRPLVLLNPNASDLMPLRRWPDERFVALGQRLLREYPDVTVAVTGAPDEQEKAEAITDEMRSGVEAKGRLICLAGKTTLRSLLVLDGLADVLVTNDSGPAHFAALTDIDIVCLFGPETPVLYRPLSPRAHCLSSGLACSPCVSVLNHRDSPCRDNQCMQRISVDEVYDAVSAILQRRRADGAPQRRVESRTTV